MALIIKDRVKEITTTTGTGAVSLGGASATFDAFQSVMSNGDTTFYAIVHTASGTDEWEVGLGTWNTGNTLTRTTVYAGSNGTSAVNFSSGNKDIFMTYPASKAAVAGEDVTFADVTATDITATGTVTLSGDPTSALQAATKEYVDTIAAAGIHYHTPVRVEAPSNLNATYDNGTSGVGATLTNAGTQAALVIDGVTLSTSDRVLVYNQINAAHNGIYTVTNTGSASTNWVLTRATDADSYGVSDPDAFGEGDAFFVKEGDTGAGELYVMNTAGTITFGTTDITFTVIAETAVYSAGTGLTLTGTTFSTNQDISTSASPTFAGATVNGNITVTGTVDGRDVATDGSKLDGIEAGATGDQTAAEIRTLVESATDSNVFTDADHTKLNGIESGATGDQTASEILTAIKTVDGVGSNLDADLLDGQQGSYYLNTSTTFSGDVSGTYGAMVVADDSHNHIISNVDGLQTALDAKADDTTTITAGSGLTGGGNLGADRTINVGAGSGITVNANDVAHADTSTQASVNNSGRTYIQDITLDGFGHVTGLTSATETVTDTNQLTTFVVEDGDGTEVTISHGKEWKFVEGGGIDINWTDTSTGSDGDPYDLTISHVDTSSQSSVNNSNGVVIQDVTLDTYGHVTGLGSVDLDGRYVNVTGDTMTGALTLQQTLGDITHLTLKQQNTSSDISSQKAFIDFTFIDANANGTPQVRIGANVGEDGGDANTQALEGSGEFVVYTATGTSDTANSLTEKFRVSHDGKLFAGSDRVFTDGYHPNADKWTTARTLSLSGDASGSVSWDGSANATLSVTVSDDSHSHSQVYIPDTRGAARAPSYYPDRYTSFDFQNYADTGAGGDTWHVLQTVSPWSTYNNAHRQQQIAFTGTGGLKFRYATSDSAWASWQTLWTSGNDGSGSGLDADLLDGVQGSSFLRSDASDTFTSLSGTSVTLGSGVVLQESTDRSDLLQITSSTSGWGGLQIRNSSNEGRWSFMTDGEAAGIYNDEDGQWHIYMNEAAGVDLRYNGTIKLNTTSYGAVVKGDGGETLTLQDTGDTHYFATAYLYFKDSAGTAMGYLGKSTYGSYDMTLHAASGGDIVLFTSGGLKYSNGSTEYNIWHAANDGSGSGLDADLWDGNQFSSYLNQAVLSTSSPSFAGLNINGSLNAVDNIYVAGNVYHEGDTDTYLEFNLNQIRLITGGSAEVTIDPTGVRLGDSGNAYVQPVSGNYGSFQIDGGAHGGWEGYSIGGNWVFMSNNADAGIYNDIDNEWMAYFARNGAATLYHNGSGKLSTSSTGVTVTGTVAATSYTGDGSSLTGISAGATGGGSDEIFWENGQTVTTNYTITNNKNAMSAGPITINSGVTVTVGDGETWTVV